MNSTDMYWQVYRQDKIRPELRGDLIYVIEVPAAPGEPAIRHVWDLTARHFPAEPRQKLAEIISRGHSGVVYQGVSAPPACEAIDCDPSIDPVARSCVSYNREILAASKQFFLDRAGAFSTPSLKAVVQPVPMERAERAQRAELDPSLHS
jgi:hypothetical protein